jgi:hypothetical protein
LLVRLPACAKFRRRELSAKGLAGFRAHAGIQRGPGGQVAPLQFTPAYRAARRLGPVAQLAWLPLHDRPADCARDIHHLTVGASGSVAEQARQVLTVEYMLHAAGRQAKTVGDRSLGPGRAIHQPVEQPHDLRPRRLQHIQG